MTDWAELFRDYAIDQDSYWPKARRHQGRKFETRVETFRKRHELEDYGDVIEKVIDLALTRRADRPLTVFLISPGSSGSHWLEGVLDMALSLTSCGEVYLPPDIYTRMDGMGPDGRATFLDCIHLLHARHEAEGLAKARLLNSAHLSGFRLEKLMAPPTTSLLLVRDPADIVMSRTYRKPGYRVQFGNLESEQFLQLNIDYVRTFFEKAAAADTDVQVRFEDMRQDLAATVRKVADGFGIKLDETAVAAAVEELGYVSGKAAPTSKTKSNVYKGPRVDIPDDVRAHVHNALADIRTNLGYGA